MSSNESGADTARRFTGRTAWARSIQTPLREFLRTETGGAAVLLAAALGALLWVNFDSGSYDSVWSTRLSIDFGGHGISLDLRGWVNSGLMAFFFFVVGLEARREFDLGELRERRRFALPLLAGLGGAAAAVGIFLVFNAGRPSAHGWGAAMSTDTAFALGLLALVGPRFPDRLRAFMLTVVVVDDIVALVVIATVYSESISWVPLLVAAIFYGGVLVLRSIRFRVGFVYFVLAAGAWVALLESGVEPVVIGLAMGILPYAYSAERSTLERATERFREFREQPTAELARSAAAQLRAATPPNERLQQLYHPWTSYGVVPLFALANAGIVIDGDVLARAFSSPITLGILFGYTFANRWRPRRLAGDAAQPRPAASGRLGDSRRRRHDCRHRIYRVTLIATRLDGRELDERSRNLSAALGARLTWLFRARALLPRRLRPRALLGTGQLTDLYLTSDPERDHIRRASSKPRHGRRYGDFSVRTVGWRAVIRQRRDFGTSAASGGTCR